MHDIDPLRPAASPFDAFAAALPARSALRQAITAAYRADEAESVARLLAAYALPAQTNDAIEALAGRLIGALRAQGSKGAVDGLIREYDLSSQEGVALMCLAEALLRIPDHATRDALIRDKIGGGDWRAHLGHSPSLFVNAATWGLVVTGKLTATANETGLGSALSRLISRGGEPLIRRGVDMAMRMMGEQFVTGETIERALANARRLEARGFGYSYDMLGEAATTAADAARYYRAYEQAILAIGRASAGRGLYAGPGISVKLSALHPRFSWAQRERVMTELLPRLRALALLARAQNIGLNIDAEETDRLDLSLDLLEEICFEPALAGWDGIGFVVQAYQKRAPFVLDFIIDLARRSAHRLMIRLVKGAYWDSEIKRAQIEGLPGYPVFTRKAHTDVSYLACARKMLDARKDIFPQFASHNAHTVAAIYTMAGLDFAIGDYEFQCLHGMGEPLYGEVVGPAKLNRPCRIYAPVGTHETLLAYLVRRLLENGANSSFVNQIRDESIPIATLAADPARLVAQSVPIDAGHPKIPLPAALYGAARVNSAGLDLSDQSVLEHLAVVLRRPHYPSWSAMIDDANADIVREIRNPADLRDIVGHVAFATPTQIDQAMARAVTGFADWRATPVQRRAEILRRAADILESRRDDLLGLIVREAGKSLPNAVGEIREAVDFLRYYAAQIGAQFDNGTHLPRGPVLCISPWNFPLAIFLGQVAAALAAGNSVIAKPAEETPLIAAQAMAILHQAGVPVDAAQCLPGAGDVGAALVADARVQAVMFTGSTDVARLIQRELAKRADAAGQTIPLIAETGGQNAMIVDSSALTEQVVADVLASAFDSAGQRCSALRVLCLQDDVAAHTLTMLRGAMAELSIGNPDRLATDVGPVISAEARDGIAAYIETMRAAGHKIHQVDLPPAARDGFFIAPTMIEIDDIASLSREIFGPVLHVKIFARQSLDRLMDDIAAGGFGLTFGIHSRIDETIAHLSNRSVAGNIYVNRNIIGAVVGVQPFGGHGLSGTGPKAGGPLLLRRLLAACPALLAPTVGLCIDLPGPVGEQNRYLTIPRGIVLCAAGDDASLRRQVDYAMATGNQVLIYARALPAGLPPSWGEKMHVTDDLNAAFDVALVDLQGAALLDLQRHIAARPGPIIPIYTSASPHCIDGLVHERSISTNIAAAGGNAQLMMI